MFRPSTVITWSNELQKRKLNEIRHTNRTTEKRIHLRINPLLKLTSSPILLSFARAQTEEEKTNTRRTSSRNYYLTTPVKIIKVVRKKLMAANQDYGYEGNFITFARGVLS